MAATNDMHARREALLAKRAQLLNKMGDRARQAFEQRAKMGFRQEGQKSAHSAAADGTDTQLDQGASLSDEIRRLISEAHRLRRKAEEERELKTAMRGLDTILKALTLLARVTGEIREQTPGLTINVVTTREEGLQTAADLLLDVASAGELAAIVERLQQRLIELPALPALPNMEVTMAAELPQSEPVQQRPAGLASVPPLPGMDLSTSVEDEVLFGRGAAVKSDDRLSDPVGPDWNKGKNG